MVYGLILLCYTRKHFHKNTKEILKTNRLTWKTLFHPNFMNTYTSSLMKGHPISKVNILGPQNWNETRIWTQIIQNLPNDAWRRHNDEDSLTTTLRKNIYPTLQILNGHSFLLCQQKGNFQETTWPRLPLSEQLNSQKRLPSTIYIRCDEQSQEHEVLHQGGHTFRLQ